MLKCNPIVWLLCMMLMLVIPLQAQKVTILDHKDKLRVTKLDILNSRYRETNLSITPNGKYLYLMSVRGEQPWSNQYMSYKGQLVYDGDIWYSKKGSNGKWQKPICLPYGINTGQGEDEPSISPDGRVVTFQSWKSFWQIDGGPYYSARLNGDAWSQPEGLGGGITRFFNDTENRATDGMSISPDGKKFIVACGTDYDGKMDLYMSKKTASGWSYLQRLPISTSGDERSVFIAADGNTIYFASDGYKGFGGLDIFKAELKADGSVGEVVNLGAPFNTPDDDYGFILTKDGKEAYFIRDGDIYFADISNVDERLKPQVHVYVNGLVKDAQSKKALKGVEVLIVDAQSEKLIEKLTTKADGKFSLMLPNQNKAYKVIALTNGYPSEERELEVDKTEFDHSYQLNFNLSKDAEVGSLLSSPQVVEEPQEELPPPKKYPEIDIKHIAPSAAPPLAQKISPPVFNELRLEVPENPYSFEGYATNHLVLLLDVSGSMGTKDKMPLLKQSLKNMAAFMRPEDRITIITFSGSVKIWAESLSAAEGKAIEKTLNQIRAGGSTQHRKGMQRAIDVAKDYYLSGGNNRIIMATDGAFDVDGLNKLVSKSAKEGIFVSVFAFGKPNKETKQKLENLAGKGNGNFVEINPDNVDEALLKEAKAFKAIR